MDTKEVETLKRKNKRKNILFWLIPAACLAVVLGFLFYFHASASTLIALGLCTLFFSFLIVVGVDDEDEEIKIYLLTGDRKYRGYFHGRLDGILKAQISKNGDKPENIIYSFEKDTDYGGTLLELAREHDWEAGIELYESACNEIRRERCRNERVEQTLLELRRNTKEGRR